MRRRRGGLGHLGRLAEDGDEETARVLHMRQNAQASVQRHARGLGLREEAREGGEGTR